MRLGMPETTSYSGSMRALMLLLGLLLCTSTGSASVDGASPRKEGAPHAEKPPKRLTDAQIKQLLIDESIAGYAGNGSGSRSELRLAPRS